MLSLYCLLASNQSVDKSTLFEIQTHLLTAGVFLDLVLKDGRPQLVISVSDELLKKEAAPSSGAVLDESTQNQADFKRQKGRPPAQPEHDITLERVKHLRFMGVPVEAIAKEIGVSKRTFYRKWRQIGDKCLDSSTPFSKW